MKGRLFKFLLWLCWVVYSNTLCQYKSGHTYIVPEFDRYIAPAIIWLKCNDTTELVAQTSKKEVGYYLRG